MDDVVCKAMKPNSLKASMAAIVTMQTSKVAHRDFFRVSSDCLAKAVTPALTRRPHVSRLSRPGRSALEPGGPRPNGVTSFSSREEEHGGPPSGSSKRVK